MKLPFPGARRPILGLGSVVLGLIVWLLVWPAISVPVIRLGPSRVKPQVIICDKFVLVLGPDGALWCWGSEDGTREHWQPRQQLGENWAAIAAGWHHAVALKRDGTLWEWKWPHRISSSAPDQVAPGMRWQAVAAGLVHSLALRQDGTIWTWGDNYDGQLGDGTTTPRPGLVQVGHDHNWSAIAAGDLVNAGLRRDGSLWIWGACYSLASKAPAPCAPKQLGSATNWTAIYGGKDAIVAIAQDGQAWLAGFNPESPVWTLPQPLHNADLVRFPRLDGWRVVVASASRKLGMKRDGRLWGYGENRSGALGDGTSVDRKEPVPIGSRHDWVAVATEGLASVGLCADRGVWAWGMRLDKSPRSSDSPRQRLARWSQSLPIRWLRMRANLEPFPVNARPELVLRFKAGARSAIRSNE